MGGCFGWGGKRRSGDGGGGASLCEVRGEGGGEDIRARAVNERAQVCWRREVEEAAAGVRSGCIDVCRAGPGKGKMQLQAWQARGRGQPVLQQLLLGSKQRAVLSGDGACSQWIVVVVVAVLLRALRAA